MKQLSALLEKKQKRYTKAEKQEFLGFLKSKLLSLGFQTHEINAGFCKTTHLETLTKEVPEIILLAHYDTSTTLPLWFEGIMRVSGHTRNLITVLLIILIFQLVALTNIPWIIGSLQIILISSLLIPILFIPNKHTMNDNTSGVFALLLLAEKLKGNPALKEKVKLVFTDNEEKSLIGSMQLKKYWNKINFPWRNAQIISVDSIGRGDNAVISYNFNDHLAKELAKSIHTDSEKIKTINMGISPFSDAWVFSKQGAVNINMMNKSLLPGGYYIKNIHCKRDREISMENVLMVVNSLDSYLRKTCV